MIFAVFDVLLAVNMCLNYSFFTFILYRAYLYSLSNNKHSLPLVHKIRLQEEMHNTWCTVNYNFQQILNANQMQNFGLSGWDQQVIKKWKLPSVYTLQDKIMQGGEFTLQSSPRTNMREITRA